MAETSPLTPVLEVLQKRLEHIYKEASVSDREQVDKLAVDLEFKLFHSSPLGEAQYEIPELMVLLQKFEVNYDYNMDELSFDYMEAIFELFMLKLFYTKFDKELKRKWYWPFRPNRHGKVSEVLIMPKILTEVTEEIKAKQDLDHMDALTVLYCILAAIMMLGTHKDFRHAGSVKEGLLQLKDAIYDAGLPETLKDAQDMIEQLDQVWYQKAKGAAKNKTEPAYQMDNKFIFAICCVIIGGVSNLLLNLEDRKD